MDWPWDGCDSSCGSEEILDKTHLSVPVLVPVHDPVPDTVTVPVCFPGIHSLQEGCQISATSE